MHSRLNTYLTLATLASLSPACSSDGAGGTGSAKIFVDAEETITDGLTPGMDLENIKGFPMRMDVSPRERARRGRVMLENNFLGPDRPARG